MSIYTQKQNLSAANLILHNSQTDNIIVPKFTTVKVQLFLFLSEITRNKSRNNWNRHFAC